MKIKGKLNEKERNSIENERKSNQNERDLIENERNSIENERQLNENERKLNENERNSINFLSFSITSKSFSFSIRFLSIFSFQMGWHKKGGVLSVHYFSLYAHAGLFGQKRGGGLITGGGLDPPYLE